MVARPLIINLKKLITTTVTTTAGATMNAVLVRSFGGPQVLRLETDVPIPEVGTNQVLVKIMASGVNPVETYIRNGTHAIRPDLPYVPGGDCAGTVETVVIDAQNNVKGLRVGQRVFTAFHNGGTYADYVVADHDKVFPLEDRLTFSQGASIGVPYFTAYRALFQKGRSTPGETVLIHGASGGVGIAAVQLASKRGLHVFGTAGTPEGLQLVLANGADKVFCHRDPNYLNDIKAATNNKGVDVIIEMLANVNLENDFNLLAQNGRTIIVGNRGTIEINPRTLMAKEASVLGVTLNSTTKEEWDELGVAIQEAIKKGWVNPVVGKEYPLSEAAQAHQDIVSPTGGAKGKMVLIVEHK